EGERGTLHADHARSRGDAMGLGLGADVHHFRRAAFIEMGEFLLHNLTMLAVRMRRLAALAMAISLAWQPALAQSLPDLGDISAPTLSESQEKTIGNKFMREVRSDPAFVDDPEIFDYVNSLGQRLLGAIDGPPRRDIDFFVVRDDSINAFAMVGGHI